MYGYAAKCNRYLYSKKTDSYQSYQQKNNEYAVCSFIESVITGSYDENGYIYIDASEYASDNKHNKYTQAYRRRGIVTFSQGVGLIFFSLLLIGMSIKILLLRKEVTQRYGFDYLTREPLAESEANLTRQVSGIMACRSESDDMSDAYEAPSSKIV